MLKQIKNKIVKYACALLLRACDRDSKILLVGSLMPWVHIDDDRYYREFEYKTY